MSYSDEMKTEAKWAEIDLDALSYNMKNIREKVGADVQICAVVKANAYGHSAEDVIGTLKEAGADAAVLQLKSLEAFAAAANGKATKIIIPSEIQGIAGLVKSIAEVAGTEKAETPEK